MCYGLALTLLALLQTVACTQISNTSCTAAECSGAPGVVDGDDTSILLQRSLVQDAQTPKTLNGNSKTDGNPKHTSEELDPKYDMYAGLVLASCALALFLIVYMLQKDGVALGMPIESGRAELLDNAKFILVSLVLVHHSHRLSTSRGYHWVSPALQPHPWMQILHLNPFAVDTLLFISGILSRGELKSEKVLIGLFGPLLGFCFVISPAAQLVLPLYIDQSPLTSLFFSATHIQWFLWALIWCRVLARMFAPFSPCIRMIAACFIASMAAYIATPVLSLEQIHYMPLFVAGQLFPYDQAVRMPWRYSTALMGLLLLVATGCVQVFCDPLSRVLQVCPSSWQQTHSNEVMNPMNLPLWWVRGLACIFLGILKSIVFLFVVCPRERTVFTECGKHSLYPYLLQVIALPGIKKVANVSASLLSDPAALPLTVKICLVSLDWSMCFLACALLSTWPVRSIFCWVLEPTWIKKLYKEDGTKTVI